MQGSAKRERFGDRLKSKGGVKELVGEIPLSQGRLRKGEEERREKG
jgi:hypothetical protein